MFNTTRALVLREVRYKEADRILTLFTASNGKITAKARGALRKNSKLAAATQQLTCAEVTLFGNKGKWSVNEAVIEDGFTGLRTDMENFALGCYFAQCLEVLSVEDEPDEAMLQLGLNSLYALSRKLYDPLLIKAAFELRLMCIAGYAPNLSACVRCGASAEDEVSFSMESGGIVCRDCCNTRYISSLPLCRDSLAALRYVTSAPAKQLFSFSLTGEALQRMADLTEQYLLMNTERSFGTLDYWKKIKL